MLFVDINGWPFSELPSTDSPVHHHRGGDVVSDNLAQKRFYELRDSSRGGGP